jgi:putative endonuclease
MYNYCVYILQCADSSYYTGVTNNLDRRLAEHQSGFDTSSYTFTRRPLKLVYAEFFDAPSKAIAFEKRIKGWSRAKKEALINEEFDLLPELSKNRQGESKSGRPSTGSG